jgi:hypothetical protein
LRWLGVRKTLSPEQKNEAAGPFGAAGEFLSARKKLLDTSHAAYREVTSVRGRIQAFWKGMTLPYPEPGIRLIRQTAVDAFHEHMTTLRADLLEAVARLDEHYAELRSSARERLGRLYDASDYPPSLSDWFDVQWDYPSVEPPAYLLQLNPEIYRQEQERVARRFTEAVQLAEQAFIGEFARLIAHLSERLTTSEPGERKVFRDSAVANLVEFFGHFRQLNIGSNEELDRLVAEAQGVVQGISPQELRGSDSLRQHIATQLAGVQSALDGMLVDRPRRRIVRSANSTDGVMNGSDR